MLTRPCAGHTGRATRRPFSYRGREDAVGRGAWDKDNRAMTGQQTAMAMRLWNGGWVCCGLPPGGSRSQTGRPAGKEGVDTGC